MKSIKSEIRISKFETNSKYEKLNSKQFRISDFVLRASEQGFTALAFLTVLGLFLAVTLALVGTGTIKLPGGANLAVSPIPISDPVEDDETCNDPYNAECDPDLENDPEDLTPAQIQKALEEN